MNKRSNRRRRRRGEAGFTLLELMTAMGVFIAGMAGVIALQAAVVKGTSISGDISVASNLASMTIEELYVRSYDTLTGSEERYFRKNGDETVANDKRRYFTVRWSATHNPNPPFTDLQVLAIWRFAMTEGYLVSESGEILSQSYHHEIQMDGRVYPR